MRFMRWSQRDYEDADADMVEEILTVMREEYDRAQAGLPNQDDDEDFEE